MSVSKSTVLQLKNNENITCNTLKVNIFIYPKCIYRIFASLKDLKNSHRRCSVRKGVFRNFTKFTEKHLCQSLFFNKVADLKLATLLKNKLWHRCFPVNFGKFLRTLFLQNTSGRLLLFILFSFFSS